MKKILIGLTLLASMSTLATTELQHGGKIIIKLDPTVMFENSGDKAVVGVDWARVKYVLTNGKAKFERSFCAQQLSAAYTSIGSVQEMKDSADTNVYSILSNLANKVLQSQFDACVTQLGIKDAANVNEVVLREMNLKH